MKKRLIRTIVLVFLGIQLVGLFPVGCGEDEEINITAEQLDQILMEVADANSNITTCKYDVNISETVKVTGGNDPGTMIMEISGDAEVNMVNKAMQMLMTMSINIPGLGEQEMEIDTYMIGEWIYTKQNTSGTGDEWTKMAWTAKVWDAQNQIAKQMEMLSSGEIECTGSKVIDGVDCYEFDIVPDGETLAEYMLDLDMPGMGEIQNLEEVLSSSSMQVTQWIAKDTYLIKKGESHMKMVFSYKDVIGATEEDFEKMALDVVTETITYDYNVPVSIELPAEAESAEWVE